MGFAVRVRSAGQKYGPTCHQRDRADVTEFVTLVRLSSLGQHVDVLALAGYKRRKSALAAGPITPGSRGCTCGTVPCLVPSTTSQELLSQYFFFFAPNQKQTFFSSQAKEQAKFFLHITPWFCQFCEQTFYFSQFTEQTNFSSLFAKQFFLPPKKTYPHDVSSGRPLSRTVCHSVTTSRPRGKGGYLRRTPSSVVSPTLAAAEQSGALHWVIDACRSHLYSHESWNCTEYFTSSAIHFWRNETTNFTCGVTASIYTPCTPVTLLLSATIISGVNRCHCRLSGHDQADPRWKAE